MVSREKKQKFDEAQAAHQREMLDKNVKKKRRSQEFGVFAVIVFLLVFVVSLGVASYQNEYNISDPISAIGPYFKLAGESPLNLFRFRLNGKYTLETVGLSTLLSVLILGYLWYNEVRHRSDLTGIEAGSAQWQKNYKQYKKVYFDNDPFHDAILSSNVRLSMDDRYTQLNNNELVFGGAGTGKSRGLVKPNILQANTNMIITDPSGELYASTGKFLVDQGYKLKVFNLNDYDKSLQYNPMEYIYSDADVGSMITCLIANTKGEGARGGDKFWEDAEKSLLSAMCYYLFHNRDKEDRNFCEIMKLLGWSKVDESRSSTPSWFSRIFLWPNGRKDNDFINDPSCLELKNYLQSSWKIVNGKKIYNTKAEPLEEFDPFGIALKEFRNFNSAPAKTANGILISAGARLHPFNVPQIARLTTKDTIALDELSGIDEKYKQQKEAYQAYLDAVDEDRHDVKKCSPPKPVKVALFVIIPAAETTYNFLVSMMYSQLFNRLYHIGNSECVDRGARLPADVKFWLDEFANIGTIPDFTNRLSTCRKYGISCGIILQSLSQIKKMYDKDWGSICANCSTLIYLGGLEEDTNTFVSKQLGEQTIIKKNVSRSQNSKGSGANSSYGKEKRALMTADELGRMSTRNCVVIIAGIDPFMSPKYRYEKHPNYKYTGDADRKNMYKVFPDLTRLTVDEAKEAAYEIEEEEAAIKLASLEDIVANNPAWDRYPDIYGRIRLIPSSLAFLAENEEEANGDNASATAASSGKKSGDEDMEHDVTEKYDDHLFEEHGDGPMQSPTDFFSQDGPDERYEHKAGDREEKDEEERENTPNDDFFVGEEL